jgi:fructokinase
MEKKYDVVALGELLIDFTENGISRQGNPLLEANPGGAPCNVLAMLGKLSHKAAFIGKVGQDMFGNQLRKAISEVGINDEGLLTDKDVHTTLAFVHTAPGGDRDFSFYRNPGADMMLNEDEVEALSHIIREAKIFHFGTLSMTHEGCRAATKKAVDMAKNAGALISFDPNLREPLWSSLDEAKEQVLYGLSVCDILKISDNEIQWLTGLSDYNAGVEWIKERFNISLILVSLGKDGSLAYSTTGEGFVPAFVRDDTIETTGAGDTFCGCVLHYVLTHGMADYTDDNLREMLTFANAAASIITTRKGALRVMPDKAEIEKSIHHLQA